MVNKYKINPKVPVRGMNTDSDPLNQPEGFATYVLNAVNDSDEGSLNTIVNEPGNLQCFALTAGYRIVGAEVIEDETVIFSTNDTNSEIGVVKGCSYTPFVNDTCLNFNMPIVSTHRIVRGCERVVYFVDGVNPDRHINLDRLFDFQDDQDDWDCNLFKLQRDYTYPCIGVTVEDGGLEKGSYQFAIKYEDANGNEIGYTPLTRQYLINDRSKFRLSITNLDESVDRFKLVVYVNDRTFLSPFIGISSSTNTFQFTSLIDYNEISIDEVIIPPSNYESSKAIEQVQNRLLRFNVKETTRDYAQLNRFSNSVSEYNGSGVTVAWQNVDLGENDRTPMRDEIYALGIMYKFNDGSLSPVFHIHAPSTTTGDGQSSSVATTTNLPLLSAFDIDYNYTAATTSFSVEFTAPTVGDIIEFRIETALGEPVYNSIVTTGTTQTLNFTPFQFNPSGPWDGTISYITSSGAYDDINLTTIIGDGTIDVAWTELAVTFAAKSIVSGTENTAEASGGLLGSHMCLNSQYTNPKCDVDFWGELAGENIAHHRMPGLDLSPIYDYGTSTKKGIQIDVTVPAYPDSDIVGHYIVYSKQERTIEQKGIMGDTYQATSAGNNTYDYIGVGSMLGGGNGTYGYYVSPDTLFETRLPDMTVVEKVGEFTLTNTASCLEYDGAGNVIFGADVDTKVGAREYSATGLSALAPGAIVDVSMTDYDYYFPRDFYNDAGDITINTSLTNDFVLGQHTGSLGLGATEIAYVAVKNTNEIYCSLENIRYEVSHDCCETPGTTNVLLPHVFVSDINFMNIFMGEQDSNVLAKLAKINALYGIAVGTVSTAIVAGPAAGEGVASVAEKSSNVAISAAASGIGSTAGGFVSKLAVSVGTALAGKILEGMNPGNINVFSTLIEGEDLNAFAIAAGGDFDGDFGGSCNIIGGGATAQFVGFAGEHLANVFIESEYNMNFRDEESVTGCPSYYDGNYDILDYMGSKVTVVDDSADNTKLKRAPNLIPCVEEYNYKQGLLSRNPQVFLGITQDIYDVCSDCAEEFPERIIWSQPSFSSDRADIYRTNRANDFVDIPAHRGAIVSAKYIKNTLYVHTTESTFIIQPNPRELQTSAETVYIGDGSFLSIPPMELIQGDVTSGGMQSVYGSCASEAGYLWVDEKNGQVYHSDRGIISNKGMKRFFRTNLKSFLKTALSVVGTDDIVLDQISVVYDHNYKRYIISKRDYSPLFVYTVDPETPTGNYFDTTDKVFKDSGGNRLDIFDPALFENKSFTISYSVDYDSWTSFHSYLPDFMYYDNDNFYTVRDNISYRHLLFNSYQNFYGTKEPFVVEYINAQPDTFTMDSLQWYSRTYEYDGSNLKWRKIDNTGFSNFWIRDDIQSTGVVDLDYGGGIFDSIFYADLTSSITQRNEDLYKVAGIRDIIDTYTEPVASSSWANLQASYPSYFEQPNPTMHNSTRSVFELSKMRGKWFKVRLTQSLSAGNDYKVFLYLVLNKNRTSIS